MNNDQGSQPMYLRIYDSILADISSGKLSPGDRVPSEKELSSRFSVSRITSKHALELLAGNKIIERFPGKGSFVARQEIAAKRTDIGLSGKNIGLVLPDFYETFGLGLLFGIEDRCRELGYSLILCRTLDRPELEEKAIEHLRQMNVDGIIVLPVHGENYNPSVLRLVLEHMPMSFVDRRLRGLAASFVGTNNIEAAKIGVSHLIDLGRQRIAFVSSPIRDTSAIEERREGFVEALADYGLPLDTDLWMTYVDSFRYGIISCEQAEANLSQMREHLSAHPDIDAVFSVEYEGAVLAREAARSLGLKVPEDIAIVCFDCPTNCYLPPAFTHLKQHEYDIGQKALDIVHAQILGKGQGNAKVYIPADLIRGESS